MNDEPYYSDLPMLFLQEYFDGQNTKVMEGTKEHPFWIIGQVKEKDDRSFLVVIKDFFDSAYLPFLLPHMVRFERVNLAGDGEYIQGIVFTEEETLSDKRDLIYRLAWK